MMEIRIDAAAIRAAAHFASKDEVRRVLLGVFIRWDADGCWEVACTDSFKLFCAWSDYHIEKPAGSVILDAVALKRELKVSDEYVFFEEPDEGSRMVDLSIKNAKKATRGMTLQSIDGTFPNFLSLLPDEGQLADGCCYSIFDPLHFSAFCKASECLPLVKNSRSRAIRLRSEAQGVTDPAIGPIYIDWPCSHAPFRCAGVLMPVRVQRAHAGQSPAGRFGGGSNGSA